MFNWSIALFALLFAVLALTATPAFGDSHTAIQLAQADDGGDDDGADDNGGGGVGGVGDDDDGSGGAGVGGDDDTDDNGGDDAGAPPVRGVQTGAGGTAGLEPALAVILAGLALATVAGGLRFLRRRA